MRALVAGLAGIVLSASPSYAVQITPVPEPSTLGLLAIGVAGVAIAYRFRNRK